tara:strand:- start:8614 stop:9873 length:1260 start_codon:yes stop_codon:yes gene_type:complete
MDGVVMAQTGVDTPNHNGEGIEKIIAQEARIRLYSDDDIFTASMAKHLPDNVDFHGKGGSPDQFTYSRVPPSDIYLIDIAETVLTPTIAEQVVNNLGEIRRQQPESYVVLFSSNEQWVDPIFKRIRDANTQLGYVNEIMERPTSSTPTNGDMSTYVPDISAYIQTRVSDAIRKATSKSDVLKCGGSLLDAAVEDSTILTNTLATIGEMHRDFGYKVILTIGGGPRHDAEKAILNILSDEAGSEQYADAARNVMYRQACLLEAVGRSIGLPVAKVPPEHLSLLDLRGDQLRSVIPIVYLTNSDIPASESDAHTLQFAEDARLPVVRFLKNTPGIYDRDPNVHGTKRNRFHQTIPAQEILDGKIDRTGDDGLGNHLIETSALELLQTFKYTKAVHIVDGTKPAEVKKALIGAPTGSYILQG